MTDKQEILTVLVPTRDRADTLVHCLKTITSQTNPNIEILVSDNFSGPEVKQVVDNIDDKRLRYIRTSERMGMSEHWDFALNHVKGDWVTIIGDDDALLPGAIDKFFTLSQKHPNIKAITCANCWYRWPNNQNEGKIGIISGRGYEIRNSREYIAKTLNGEPVSQPTIYTGGFVHMDVINKSKEQSKDGVFFHSMNPDLYSGMAISSITDKFIYSWQAWAIAGTSRHSTGFSHKDKTQKEVETLPFHQESKLKFHSALGDSTKAFVGSMHIYLYEAYLQTSFLRNYDLGYSIENQLKLFIAQATKRTKQSITSYCRQVATLNNLDFAPILAAANRRRPMYKIKKMARKLARHIPGMSKLPRKVILDPSIRTVYDASIRIGKELAA